MATYHIDLGYDVNAVTSSNNVALLQWGVVNATNNPAVPGTTVFQVNDTIQFYVYDISSIANPSVQESTTPSSGSSFISPVAADNPNTNPGQATRPVDVLMNLNALQAVSGGNANSTFFGGPFPAWALCQSSQPPAFAATLNHAGVFNITLQITVSGTNGGQSYSQTFATTFVMNVESSS